MEITDSVAKIVQGKLDVLELGNLDWRAGQLRLRAGKCRRERVLPLPQEVGAALARDSNLPPAFFAWWFANAADVPGIVGDAQVESIAALWRIAREMELIAAFPDPRELVSDLALRD